MSAAFSSGRNASNSTAASNASSWSPRSLNRFNRSSTSKNPACLRIESSPIHPSQWNQKGGELDAGEESIMAHINYMGIGVELISTLNKGELPPVRLRILSDKEDATAQAVEKHI